MKDSPVENLKSPDFNTTDDFYQSVMDQIMKKESGKHLLTKKPEDKKLEISSNSCLLVPYAENESRIQRNVHKLKVLVLRNVSTGSKRSELLDKLDCLLPALNEIHKLDHELLKNFNKIHGEVEEAKLLTEERLLHHKNNIPKRDYDVINEQVLTEGESPFKNVNGTKVTRAASSVSPQRLMTSQFRRNRRGVTSSAQVTRGQSKMVGMATEANKKIVANEKIVTNDKIVVKNDKSFAACESIWQPRVNADGKNIKNNKNFASKNVANNAKVTNKKQADAEKSQTCSSTSKASPNQPQPPQTGPMSPRQPQGPQQPALMGPRQQGPTDAIARKKSPKPEVAQHKAASASVKKKSPKQEPQQKPKWRSSIFSRSNTIASLLLPSSGDKNKNAKKHDRRSCDVTKKQERKKVTSATSWTYDNGDDVTVLWNGAS